ncbi:MAG: dihydrolipoyl dehydrogenase [Candidatus Thermoplasmatota archaeon]|jgi:dihydrolipoamide dehydrogenase|nr:dihydrolipoyl dehydrogenase [Candidatus Thermoplasmatota archaeon]
MNFDAIIIGSGPGGYATAIRLGQKGKKVLLIEKDRIGGECLNYGCIPSKALIEMASSIHYLKNMPGFKGDMSIDLAAWQDWKWGMIGRLTGGVETLCKSYGVQIERGTGTIIDRNTVSVDGRNYTGDYLVIATGSSPVRLPGMDMVMQNRDILDLKELPESLAIIGGGYIGIELGTAFAKLGTSVTIIEMMDQILPGVDRDITRPVARTLRELSVEVLTSTKVESVREENGFVLHLSSGSDIHADKVLLTVGRVPNTSGFGLENLGLEMDGKFIKTDFRKRTSIDTVYALGDVSGGPMLAHKAFYEAEIVADNICGEDRVVDYHAMPFVIYSDPEISYTGDIKGEFKSFPLGANGRALGMNSSNGFYRIYCDSSGNVKGSALVAPHSSEMIGEMTLAVESGLNAMDIGLTIHPHPTISEGLMEVAQGVYSKPLHFKPRD